MNGRRRWTGSDGMRRPKAYASEIGGMAIYIRNILSFHPCEHVDPLMLNVRLLQFHQHARRAAFVVHDLHRPVWSLTKAHKLIKRRTIYQSHTPFLEPPHHVQLRPSTSAPPCFKDQTLRRRRSTSRDARSGISSQHEQRIREDV
jgi:hypothetical protein